jgi:hypothetical protein
MIEEKEYIDKIQKELEEEKMKNKLKKLRGMNDRLNEYQSFLEKKKVI